MKKIIAVIAFCLLMFMCVGCEETPTNIDVSGVVFEDATFEYQEGQFYYIEVENLPNGATVVYLGNGVSEVGTHTVTAVIRDSSGNELKKLEANITIISGGSSIDPGTIPQPTPGGNPGGSAEYVMSVNGTLYDLNVNASASLLPTQTGEYMYIGLNLNANDVVEFYHNNELITAIGPENGANLKLTAEAGVMTVLTANSDAQVYFKTWADGGHSVYITSQQSSGGNPGGNPGETITLTFVPGVWDKDGAWFAAYWWNESGSNGWVKIGGDGSFSVPQEATKIIFVRMSNTSTAMDWTNKWNQTSDLTISGSKYTISGWGESDGSWS